MTPQSTAEATGSPPKTPANAPMEPRTETSRVPKSSAARRPTPLTIPPVTMPLTAQHASIPCNDCEGGAIKEEPLDLRHDSAVPHQAEGFPADLPAVKQEEPLNPRHNSATRHQAEGFPAANPPAVKQEDFDFDLDLDLPGVPRTPCSTPVESPSTSETFPQLQQPQTQTHKRSQASYNLFPQLLPYPPILHSVMPRTTPRPSRHRDLSQSDIAPFDLSALDIPRPTPPGGIVRSRASTFAGNWSPTGGMIPASAALSSGQSSPYYANSWTPPAAPPSTPVTGSYPSSPSYPHPPSPADTRWSDDTVIASPGLTKVGRSIELVRRDASSGNANGLKEYPDCFFEYDDDDAAADDYGALLGPKMRKRGWSEGGGRKGEGDWGRWFCCGARKEEKAAWAE